MRPGHITFLLLLAVLPVSAHAAAPLLSFSKQLEEPLFRQWLQEAPLVGQGELSSRRTEPYREFKAGMASYHIATSFHFRNSDYRAVYLDGDSDDPADECAVLRARKGTWTAMAQSLPCRRGFLTTDYRVLQRPDVLYLVSAVDATGGGNGCICMSLGECNAIVVYRIDAIGELRPLRPPGKPHWSDLVAGWELGAGILDRAWLTQEGTLRLRIHASCEELVTMTFPIGKAVEVRTRRYPARRVSRKVVRVTETLGVGGHVSCDHPMLGERVIDDQGKCGLEKMPAEAKVTAMLRIETWRYVSPMCHETEERVKCLSARVVGASRP